MTKDEIIKKFLDGLEKYNNEKIEDAINLFMEINNECINIDLFDQDTINIIVKSIENIGVCYSKIANYNKNLVSFNEGLKYFDKALNLVLSNKVQYKEEHIVSISTNKIATLFKLNDNNAIIEFSNNFIEELSTYINKNKEKILSEFYNYMGIAEYKLNKNEKSIKSYKKSIECNPYNMSAYRNIGLVYQKQGNILEFNKYSVLGVEFKEEKEYKMYIQTLSGYSFGLTLKTKYQCLIFDFMSVFSDINYIEKNMNFMSTHKVTKELTDKIRSFCNKYRNDNNNDILNELLNRFTNAKKIPLGDYFCILPGVDIIGAKEYIEVVAHLTKEVDINEYLKLKDGLDNIFLSTFLYYDIQRENNPYNLDEDDKRKELRYCKYCNKFDTNLENKSHIIPKSLGGHIIDEEECTTCNHETLKNSIENDLGKYLAPWKTIYGIKGYNQIPKFETKNGYIDYSSDMNKLKIGSDNLKFDNNGLPKYLELYLGKISMRNVYRMMVKMSIGYMTKQYIDDNFNKDIINFINQKEGKIKLPPIITYFNRYFKPSQINNKNKNENVFITTFYKKDKTNNKLPTFVSEFIFYNFCYIFIIPFAKNDIIDFSDEENFNYFCKKWHSSQFDFHLMNCNKDEKIDVNLKINFEVYND